ncbi:MAG: hypothetical protein QXQ16_01875 [Candidatus Aenigmatarchaeota archaeon]
MLKIDEILEYLPTVKPPERPLTVEEKIKNSILVIVIYVLLASIPIFGISPVVSQRFLEFMWVFGSHIGTLATVGIAPIIMAGLFMQLLIFSGIVNINIFDEESRAKYDSYVKFLSIIFLLIQSISFILSGNVIPDHNLPISLPILYFIIFLQLFLGGLIIILLDDFSAKYGVLSGINLIIFVSISISVALRIFNPVPSPQYAIHGLYMPTGLLPQAIVYLIQGNISFALALIFKVLLTFAILALVAYLQSVKIEIPLLYINIGGRIIKYPLNLLYTSVLPAIFLYGIITWFQVIFGRNPNSILYRLFLPPNLIINISQYGLSYLLDLFNIFHILFYLIIFVIGGMLFSYMWVTTSGMDAKTIAKYLQTMPIQTLKYRDPRLIEKTLEKYINTLAYLSGIMIGFIAAISDILGVAVSGISLLLLVVIASQMYMELERNGAIQYLPLIGKYLIK